MISKNQIKFIKSLEQKKFRKEHQAFVAEGPKLVQDILPHFTCIMLVATPQWFSRQQKAIGLYAPKAEKIEVSQEELQRVSLQKNPQEVLAVFNIPVYSYNLEETARQSLCLALDDIQDPGNLGTIVRIADWFGIEHIFCTPGTTDIYNPKTIQATMGAIARVKVHYIPLAKVLSSTSVDFPVYGTLLDGKNIYGECLADNGLIVMGNEGNGISEEIRKLVTHRLLIPSFPTSRPTSESLNVAVATAIVCAEFRRRQA